MKKQKLNKTGGIKETKKNEVESKPVAQEQDSEVSEDNEDLDDLEEDDEVDVEVDDEADVENVSSDEESGEEQGVGSDEDSDSDDEGEDVPKLKKKKNLDDGSESFANAFSAIVGSRLKAYNRKDPILAKNKTTLKKLESDKLEAKAKRLLLSEKKQLYDTHRVTNLLPSAEEPEKVALLIRGERHLKKIAQKGVVRLFNAVLSTQVRTIEEVGREKVGQTKKEELMNEISKEKFLDLVQAAGQS